MRDEIIIISVGGSLIFPEEIDVEFLKKLKSIVLRYIENGKRFVLIPGGGKICRKYQNAAKQITDLKKEDLDWLGIHSTRINAHLLRTIFHDFAHPKIFKHYDESVEFTGKILIAAGWKPGWSTDYCAVKIAKKLNVKKLINLSNINYAYDKDPKKFSDAKIIKEISWHEFRKLIPEEWNPGLNSPFDPIASKEAEELGIEVAIINGKKIEEMEKYIKGKEFIGTGIK
jgi:uridylate kinase